MKRVAIVILIMLAVSACGRSDELPGHDDFVRHVSASKVGSDTDQWIEMQNAAGQWERTGLVFGYTNDQEECLKAIAGLKKVNYAREYRCTAAN